MQKNKLHSGIKKIKRSHRVDDVLKEDCQAFRTIIAKTLTLDEVFQYPITSV